MRSLLQTRWKHWHQQDYESHTMYYSQSMMWWATVSDTEQNRTTNAHKQTRLSSNHLMKSSRKSVLESTSERNLEIFGVFIISCVKMWHMGKLRWCQKSVGSWNENSAIWFIRFERMNGWHGRVRKSTKCEFTATATTFMKTAAGELYDMNKERTPTINKYQWVIASTPAPAILLFDLSMVLVYSTFSCGSFDMCARFSVFVSRIYWMNTHRGKKPNNSN